MEYNLLVLLLLAVFGLCAVPSAQGLELTLEGVTNRMEKPGVPVTLTCVLDQGLPVILSHTVRWVHVPIDSEDQRNPSTRRETVLTRQQTLSEDASPDEYGIDVKYNDSHCTFKLTLKNIKPENDGMYICRAIKNSDNQVMQKDADIIVVNDVQKVSMQFDGEESIAEVSDVVIQREQGHYGISCTAFGFNPQASVHIFLGDEELTKGGTQILPDWDMSATAKARRYIATATASKVELGAKHSGQTLKCSASADFQGAQTVSVSVPLSVISYEPVIECQQNVSARVGDNYVKIRCRVDHTNVQIQGYKWEIGQTGEIIEPGQNNPNYHEVAVEQEDEHTTYVTLDLFQVDNSHFSTYYYLDVITPNEVFRAQAALVKLDEGDLSASTRTSAGPWVCLLLAVLSVFGCY